MTNDSTHSQASDAGSTSDGLDGAALRRIERAVDRFEEAWQRGETPPLEDLLGEPIDTAERDELLKYALAVELSHRRRRCKHPDEMPTAAEYERRFPDHVALVRSAFVAEPTVAVPTRTPSDGNFLDRVTADWFSAETTEEPLPATIGKFAVLGRVGKPGGQGSAFLPAIPTSAGWWS